MADNEYYDNNKSDFTIMDGDREVTVRHAKLVYSDSKSFWLGFFSFLYPIVGFWSYIIWKEDRPKRAHSCLSGAIVGLIIGILVIAGIVALQLTLGVSVLELITPSAS